MRIFQKNGKCTIESEGAAKVGQSYTLKQFVDDLIRMTREDALEWRLVTENGCFFYRADIGDTRIDIDYIGWGRWVFSHPFCQCATNPQRQPAPRSLVSVVRQYLKRKIEKDRLQSVSEVFGRLESLFRPGLPVELERVEQEERS